MNTSLALAVFSHAKHSSAELAACRFSEEQGGQTCRDKISIDFIHGGPSGLRRLEAVVCH